MIVTEHDELDEAKDRLTLGTRVLVHQSGGIKLGDGTMERIPHDCSDPSAHWESRIVGWSEYHQMPQIATRCRGERGNPCHAEWPYGIESLSLIEDDEDWTEGSAYRMGMEVDIVLDDDIPQYPKGTRLKARIEAPHIELEDWYVSFEVPDRSRGTQPGDTWRFKRVVNEKDFIT